MKLRSTVFLTLSLIVHAVCITALALSHFKGVESPNGNNVEVTMGDSAKTEDGTQPEMKPIEKEKIEKVEAPKPAPKKIQPKKIAKAAKPATVLPPKIKTEVAEQEPESMNPKIDAEAAPVFVPVKEKVEAQAADDTEDKTEANSKETQVEDPAPVPAKEDPKPATSGKTETPAVEAKVATAAPLGHGGETKSEAVPVQDLKQYSGNKSPEYPLAARKEQRQGQVDLLYRVTKDGRVAEVQVNKSSGHSDLDEAAVKAVSKFKFFPGQEGWAKQPVIFTLKGIATALPSKLRTNSAATE